MEYQIEKQKLLVSFLVSSGEGFARCNNIVQPSFFDSSLQKTVGYIKDYVDQYKTIPTVEEINVNTNTKIKLMTNLNDHHVDALLDEMEKFCRHKAAEQAVLKGSDYLREGNYDEILRGMKEATQVSLTKDLGTNFFQNPQGLLNDLRNNNNQRSTGWKDVDDKLYGGFSRKELQLWAGPPGSGKSLFLQNGMVNWLYEGLNCVYITLELSEALVAYRLYAMFTGIHTTEIWSRSDEVHRRIKMSKKQEGLGELTIKFMPIGTTTNDIAAYMKELEIQKGYKVDALFTDYLDLLHPNSRRINPSDLFVKDKYVSEELRSLGAEMDIFNVTASQLNRTSITDGALEYDMSMIAGGISKINTADNVMALFTSDAMRQRGEYRIQFLKTRSSSGVGSKILLGFDQNCLRITDHVDGSNGGRKSNDEISDEIRSGTLSSTITPITFSETSSAGPTKSSSSALNTKSQILGLLNGQKG